MIWRVLFLNISGLPNCSRSCQIEVAKIIVVFEWFCFSPIQLFLAFQQMWTKVGSSILVSYFRTHLLPKYVTFLAFDVLRLLSPLVGFHGLLLFLKPSLLNILTVNIWKAKVIQRFAYFGIAILDLDLCNFFDAFQMHFTNA